MCFIMIETLYKYKKSVLIPLPGKKMWNKLQAILATVAWEFLMFPWWDEKTKFLGERLQNWQDHKNRDNYYSLMFLIKNNETITVRPL